MIRENEKSEDIKYVGIFRNDIFLVVNYGFVWIYIIGYNIFFCFCFIFNKMKVVKELI